MTRPCTCHRIRPGPYTLDQCRLCWLAANDSRYQELWGLPVTATASSATAARAAPTAPCVHLGPATGATVRCPSCQGHVEVKLYECDVYQQCTLARKAEATACCRGCPSYQPATPAPDH